MATTLQDRMRDLLIQRHLVSAEALEEILKTHREEGGSLGRILIQSAHVEESLLLGLLSQEFNIPPINLAKYRIDPSVSALIPENLVRQYRLVPIARLGSVLTVAMVDPLNILAIDDVRLLTRFEILPVLASEKDVETAIERVYAGTLEGVAELISQSGDLVAMGVGSDTSDVHVIAEESRQAPIITLVDRILSEALQQRASDIHVEPERDDLRIRYRVDGHLHEVLRIPKKNQNAVLARLKIMAGLDITENRVPQDGRFRIQADGKEVDFRVSILPLLFGGKVVLRALDRSSLASGLDTLGFLPEHAAIFEKSIQRTSGMILVTGPTGSGKSTTLYTLLQMLNVPEKNLVTIEDPVEYQVEGITQIQVKREIDLDFAQGLRSVLRQAPDVIMVGEIRDGETADIAVKAALTGQLVLSTLHTNDAPGAITRLMDMKVEPFLIASSVVVAAGQRLCRRICSQCKESVTVSPEVLERVGFPLELRSGTFLKSRGCKRCRQTGYYVRLATLEVLQMDDTMRDLVLRRASSEQIREAARARGFRTLRENGFRLVSMGMTTLEEILRVTTE